MRCGAIGSRRNTETVRPAASPLRKLSACLFLTIMHKKTCYLLVRSLA